MSWFNKFLTSSLGQKVVMSLTGLFLMLFLVIHLIGNLQLLKHGGGVAFNTYAYFMTNNHLIKVGSYRLYAFMLLHAWEGMSQWAQNSCGRGNWCEGVSKRGSKERASRNMAWLGVVIFAFIVIHMWQFWFQMHWGGVDEVQYPMSDHKVKDLYALVAASYTDLFFVVFYVVSMGVVSFHLWHGFWSAFQTLGLNHTKWTPVIKFIGYAYAIGVPVLFALSLVMRYFNPPATGLTH